MVSEDLLTYKLDEYYRVRIFAIKRLLWKLTSFKTEVI
jgi:hypothetical protein